MVRECQDNGRRTRGEKYVGKRWRGRQNLTSLRYSYSRDMKSAGLKMADVTDRTQWNREIPNYSNDPTDCKRLEK